MNELTIPTDWLDPRLGRVRDLLATVMRADDSPGSLLELRLAAAAAFLEIEGYGDLPYPPAGEGAVAGAAAIRVALTAARAGLLELIPDVGPEHGYRLAYAARELAEALTR